MRTMERERAPRWRTVLLFAPIPLIIGVLVLRLNPQQQMIPRAVDLIFTTSVWVFLIINFASVPVFQNLKSIPSEFSNLYLHARIGFILFAIGLFILVASIPLVLLVDWFWILVPAATMLYVLGLFLLRRARSPAWFRRRDLGYSLWTSMIGLSWLQDFAPDSMREWVSNAFMLYAIVLIPVGGAMIIVRDHNRREVAGTAND
jgi:hypothetical protein